MVSPRGAPQTNGPVVGLGAAGGEEYLLGTDAQQRRDGLSGGLKNGSCLGPGLMQPAGIAEPGLHGFVNSPGRLGPGRG